MATDLHRSRLEAVTQVLLSSGTRRVADLGCGRGELLQCLRAHDQFTRLTGIDIDAGALAHARTLLGLGLSKPDARLHVYSGSFEETDWAITGFDAAVLLETIEHIDPGRLSRVERALFGRIRPELIVITTPNQEYNPLYGLSSVERRHPGHRFEWTRAQFRSWCGGVAERHGYGVSYQGIGPPDPIFGSSTQMACFTKVTTRQSG